MPSPQPQIALIGSSGSGKSSLSKGFRLHSKTTGTNESEIPQPTTSISCTILGTRSDAPLLYDTPGRLELDSGSSGLLTDTDLLLLAIDLGDLDTSFATGLRKLDLYKSQCKNPDVTIMFVLTKQDIGAASDQQLKNIRAIAKKYNATIKVCSAQTGKGIEEVVHEALQLAVITKTKFLTTFDEGNNSVKLTSSTSENSKLHETDSRFKCCK